MKRRCIAVALLVAAGSMPAAAAGNYFLCYVGPDRSIQQEVFGIHAGIGGFKLVGNVLLIGGFGEYFGSDSGRTHLGNGGAILGLGHIVDHRLLLGIEGVAGLGGGIINQEAGAVYVYGGNAFLGHCIAEGAYLGFCVGYRSIGRFIGLRDREDSHDYLLIGLRVACGR